ncbi:Putative Trp operon leader peptide [Serratia symbiotica SCt-VLC]|uniref:Putative Trp operon leader peptide n=1 Tax=Serratia symbiotica SCt-VLC TaxID=1347341 RepID=A0A068RBY2_9GAMM|nr:Putative Trp operon leader peptide [Serratia symbiotica SCt-VLC]
MIKPMTSLLRGWHTSLLRAG